MSAQVYPIATRPPEFPCWLWSPHSFPKARWIHHTNGGFAVEKITDIFSHWSPDSATPPTVVPGEERSPRTASMMAPSELREVLAKQKGEDWATAAAREIRKLAVEEANNGMMPDRSDIAAIICRHAPSPQTAGLSQEVKEAVERLNEMLLVERTNKYATVESADLRLLLAHVGKGVGN